MGACCGCLKLRHSHNADDRAVPISTHVNSDPAANSSPTKKTYSWDVRRTVDPKDYTIENIENDMVYKLPGSIRGNQFIIQNCKSSRIYLFDNTATVTVDDCTGCKIFLGPIKSSVFIRNCQDCRIIVACQQFRIRDCTNLVVFLCCTTQPIIESASHIKFGCFQVHYPQLEEQFILAGMSLYNNNWSDVHDFTPAPGEKNYSILSSPVKDYYLEYMDMSECQQFIDVSQTKSIIPRTLDAKQKSTSDACLVVFFHDDIKLVPKFIARMLDENKDKELSDRCDLIQTKEVKLRPEDANKQFNTDKYTAAVNTGPVIGMEYSGKEACTVCHTVVQALMSAEQPSRTDLMVYVSDSAATASKDVESFYNFASMLMHV